MPSTKTNEAAPLLSRAYQLLRLENFGHASILKLHTPHRIAGGFFNNYFSAVFLQLLLPFPFTRKFIPNVLFPMLAGQVV
jgi:hypothetical protein